MTGNELVLTQKFEKHAIDAMQTRDAWISKGSVTLNFAMLRRMAQYVRP